MTTFSDSHITDALQKTFGFDQFRPHQQVLVEGVLEGRDVFGVMPTGGGKSLCYQLPGAILDGTAVVVSPLIALMKDQVDAANANGISAAFLNSTLPPHEAAEVESAYRSGALDLLYLAPERLALRGCVEMLRQNAQGRPSFFAIDEAHCISEWGHDFRPDYLMLSKLKEMFPGTPVAAFTATATEVVARDIDARLKLDDPVRVRASFDRHNLYYEVRSKQDWQRQIVEFIRDRPGQSGIIYRTSRKSVDATAEMLKANGINAEGYHAGLEAHERTRIQDAFIRDDTTVMVATVAFGMGVDKADIRYVIHGDLPKNIESYYQETGRAGRDGEPSRCLLLYSPGDSMKIRRFFDEITDQDEKQRATQLLRAMERFASVPQCRRINLLAYFNETYPHDRCDHCDFCDGQFKLIDATRPAQMILSAVKRTDNRFGAVHICDIVAGADTAKIRQFRHNELPTYAVGKDHPKTYWRKVIDALLSAGHLETSTGTFAVPALSASGADILFGRTTFHMNEDTRQEPAKETRGRSNNNEPQACDDGLFNHLRILRKEVADAANVPPYVVFSDRSLRAMAAHMPESDSELLQLHGIGEMKVSSYGTTFLEAIQSYLTDHPEIAHSKVPITETAAKTSRSSTSIKRGISPTAMETYNLLQQGLDIESIAKQRGFATSTIESHLAILIEEGKDIDWKNYITTEQFELCAHLFGEMGDTLLAPIIEAGNGKINYSHAKITRAVLAKEP